MKKICRECSGLGKVFKQPLSEEVDKEFDHLTDVVMLNYYQATAKLLKEYPSEAEICKVCNGTGKVDE